MRLDRRMGLDRRMRLDRRRAVSSRPRGDSAVRPLFDVAVCLLAAPVVLPLLAMVAFAIRLDSPGPVIFTQLRTGQHGRRFRMFKFRTMVVNAEALKATLAHRNILPPPDFKVIDDPRITRLGKYLRRTSLDELPQLINVMRGDMALVGPRPTSFAPATYDIWHSRRLDVRPGITGLWQVRGRNAMSFNERLRLDIQYIRSRSIRADLRIMVETLASVAKRSGA